MIFGDSVIYAGVQIDQSQMATECLKRLLQEKLHRPVTVGSIAAPSWGPSNELAYARRYGSFEADYVVLALNSEDYGDVPTFAPTVGVLPDYPSESPLLASQELFSRYLTRYFTGPKGGAITAHGSTADFETSLRDEWQFFDLVRRTGATPILLQEIMKEESAAAHLPGYYRFGEIARRKGVAVVDLTSSFETARAAGVTLYLDRIHPNAIAQEAMAESIAEAVSL